MNTEYCRETENGSGVPSRYVNGITAQLNVLAASFEDVQQGRIRASNRGDEYSADELKKLEDRLGRRLRSTLELHELWPWLSTKKGLAGPRTARVIAAIGDPRRFPGQQCSEGHTLHPLFPAGSACLVEEVPTADSHVEIEGLNGGGEVSDGTEDADESGVSHGSVGVSPDSDVSISEIDDVRVRCPGIMSDPRTTTGVRSLWHYAGLHVVDGHLPKRRKGVQSDWKPGLRTLVVGPKGIGDQIVMQRTEPYRTIYDEVKARKVESGDLPLWRADKIAKTVAAKAFLADLLVEWKTVGGAAATAAIESRNGPSDVAAA